MSKRVIVTGGAGFIGSHLCERLLNDGNYVICVDNLFTGRKENIGHLIHNKSFEFIEHDVIFPLYIESNEIYNLACPASPLYYQQDPIKTAKTSIFGSVNMLELAKKTGSKILQASTSEIYGNPLIHPQKENYWGNVNPLGIRSCYDEGKRAAETFFMDYYRKHGVQVKIIRIFNTYGPRMSPMDGRVISNFIIQALKNEDVTIYGDGSQIRSFCYIYDLIKVIPLMMNTDDNFTGPVNIGNPEECTILSLAEKIIKLTDSKSKIVSRELPEDDPIKRRPNIALAKKNLNWEPKISLESGLIKTIEYFKDTLALGI